ncbi:hypothetical protein [Acidaminococcus fermentans]|uniref:hypothetical protein n=1 Tax=Acidaminococcus fermentans TaxID=905 RepID=UPI002492E7CD|nr:hypothetical protein [Acidaminococcus fermentans]
MENLDPAMVRPDSQNVTRLPDTQPKLARKMDCKVQYYMPMLNMAALELDKPVKNSREMQQVLEKLNGTPGVIMADVNRVVQMD